MPKAEIRCRPSGGLQNHKEFQVYRSSWFCSERRATVRFCTIPLPGVGKYRIGPLTAAPKSRCPSPEASLKHDPEKCEAVFPRDKRGTRLRGDHAQTTT